MKTLVFYFRLPVPVSVPSQGIGLMHLVFPKGFSVNFVLLTWALFGGLFIYAFLANFRTMLLMPQYEKPVDSAQDVLDRGMIPFVVDGGDYWKPFLLQSSNPVYQKLGEIVIVPKDYDQHEKMLREVQGSNTHVYLGQFSFVVNYISWDGSISGKYHESKEVLEGTNPFVGDIVNKKWSLSEEYSYHYLLFQQVKPFFKYL